MTAIRAFDYKEQSNKLNINDENTSDDSLLLMANLLEDRAPLLHLHDDESIKDDHDIPLRQRTSTIHCHVPDEHFDYVARNRLIVVLLLCVTFMIIEIIGRSACLIHSKTNSNFL